MGSSNFIRMDSHSETFLVHHKVPLIFTASSLTFYDQEDLTGDFVSHDAVHLLSSIINEDALELLEENMKDNSKWA